VSGCLRQRVLAEEGRGRRAESTREEMSNSSADAHYEPPEQFRSIITSTMNKLLRAADPKFDASDGWELLKVKNGVTMHRKRAEKVKGERAIATIRGTGLVRCDAATYVSLATDLGQRRKTWDTVFLQGKLVEVVDECTSIVWLELRSKKCVMEVHRDVLYMQHTRRLGNTHVVASRSAGVLQTLIPSPPGAVRATLHTSGYVVRPADDELGTCEVTYVVQFDSGGPIPTALLNRISEDLPQCIARQRTAYADLYGGGGIGPFPLAVAEEEEEEDEEVPVSGDMLEDVPPQQPALLKTQSLSLPLRIGTTRNALSESSDSVYSPKSPKSSPRIGMVRQSSAAASPRQTDDEPRVSPRVQSAKALPQPPSSPRGSTSPRSNAPDAPRAVASLRPVVDASPRFSAPEAPRAAVSPRAVADTSPRPVRPSVGSGALPAPSSPRGGRPLPVVPPLATGAIAAEQRNSPVPSPRGSPMPSPRSGGPVPPPPKTAPTPPPRHN
jgi:hypothetical protein